tara:strand:+ start:9773 stop:10573 length:801 start_codon:yes stop_codon:yes gene_type:complete
METTQSPSMNQSELVKVAELLSRSKNTVVLAGAGMSKESGIPTFRGKGGLWTINGEPPLNQYEIFLDDPKKWWSEKFTPNNKEDSFATALDQSKPNDGHNALVQLERLGIISHLITQNVDDLHRQAGQISITEIHGNRYWIRCIACNSRWPKNSISIQKDLLPPRCEICNGILKSDTVMFGEPIPPNLLQDCHDATRKADLFLTIGTSAIVYPAAQFPIMALEKGIPLIEINPETTPLSEFTKINLRGPSGQILPELIKLISENQV